MTGSDCVLLGSRERTRQRFNLVTRYLEIFAPKVRHSWL